MTRVPVFRETYESIIEINGKRGLSIIIPYYLRTLGCRAARSPSDGDLQDAGIFAGYVWEHHTGRTGVADTQRIV